MCRGKSPAFTPKPIRASQNNGASCGSVHARVPTPWAANGKKREETKARGVRGREIEPARHPRLASSAFEADEEIGAEREQFPRDEKLQPVARQLQHEGHAQQQRASPGCSRGPWTPTAPSTVRIHRTLRQSPSSARNSALNASSRKCSACRRSETRCATPADRGSTAEHEDRRPEQGDRAYQRRPCQIRGAHQPAPSAIVRPTTATIRAGRGSWKQQRRSAQSRSSQRTNRNQRHTDAPETQCLRCRADLWSMLRNPAPIVATEFPARTRQAVLSSRMSPPNGQGAALHKMKNRRERDRSGSISDHRGWWSQPKPFPAAAVFFIFLPRKFAST